jgi:xanthine dehydrogenase accessory factor
MGGCAVPERRLRWPRARRASVGIVLTGSQHAALEWLADGRRVVAATLVETVGSAPLDPGAEMLVDDAGRIEGSVTGGCVEGALVGEAQEVLAGGPPRVATYGISDQEAADVGLMCGGTVRIFVHEVTPHREVLQTVAGAVDEERPVALATVLDGDSAGAKMAVTEDAVAGGLGVTDLLDRGVEREARGFLDEGLSAVRRYSADGEVMGDELRVAIQAFAVPPSMVIFGAIDFSAALAPLARQIGYRVTIVDAREPFARSPRFSANAEVVVDWPDRHLAGRELGRRDAVLVFTHDPKFDEPALRAALASGAGYIGALGSRRTHADRMQRLREAGVRDDELARINSPCGLDVGARTPAETAIAVLGEILALRAGRAGGRLAEASGPIHPRAAERASTA